MAKNKKTPPKPEPALPEAFIGTEYLDSGKGPAARMIRITPRKLKAILVAWSIDRGADEDAVDGMVEAIEDQCENLDPAMPTDVVYLIAATDDDDDETEVPKVLVRLTPADAVKLYALRDAVKAAMKTFPDLVYVRLATDVLADATFGDRPDALDVANDHVGNGWSQTSRKTINEDDDSDGSHLLVYEDGIRWEMVCDESDDSPYSPLLPWNVIEKIAAGKPLGGKPDGE